MKIEDGKCDLAKYMLLFCCCFCYCYYHCLLYLSLLEIVKIQCTKVTIVKLDL